MRILVLSCHNFPYPPSRGATEGRTFNLIKCLHQNHDVTLFARRVENVTETQIEELKTFTNHLVLFPPQEIPEPGKGLTKLIGQTGRFLEAIVQMTPANV
ncbi:MAG: glycosyl transferase family 1, partial [Microcystis sp.]